MRISKIKREAFANRERIAALVNWEDNDFSELTIFFETEIEFGSALTSLVHPFVIACILPAFHHGEKRLTVDEPLCAELKEGLETIMHWLRLWYYDPLKSIPIIEPKNGIVPFPKISPRAGFFFSGGIDCLATLRSNRIRYPAEHPGYIKDGIIIYGQNIESDTRPDIFQKAVSKLGDVATASGITLMPVYTNVRDLEPERSFFSISQGALLAAVAHAMSNRLTSISIASSDSLPGLSFVKDKFIKPLGSHPLIDPNYSSANLKVKHDGILMTRLDKVRLIADWEVGLHNIKVCGPNWPGENCGCCEKCVRTMLALLAVGSLAKSRAFPIDDISPDLVTSIYIKKPKFGYSVDGYYLELIKPLLDLGRQDLVEGIHKVVNRSKMQSKNGIQLKCRKALHVLWEIDQKCLHGVLRRAKRRLGRS